MMIIRLITYSYKYKFLVFNTINRTQIQNDQKLAIHKKFHVNKTK